MSHNPHHQLIVQHGYIFVENPDLVDNVDKKYALVNHLNRLEFMLSRNDRIYWILERNSHFCKTEIEKGSPQFQHCFIATPEQIEERKKLLEVEVALDRARE